MSFQFGTKAETLDRLSRLVHRPKFCEQFFFSVEDWYLRRTETIDRALSAMNGSELVVRSSARHEDGEHSSMAGAFLSVVGVSPDQTAFSMAVDRVVESYRNPASTDQILVQPRIRDVVIAGVVMTRDLDTGAPYYVINYDDVTGRTDSVTGGAESKTILVHRSRPDRLKSPRMRRLVEAVIEIEETTGSDELDVEFCINSSDENYIVQVRSLAAKRNWGSRRDDLVDRAIDETRETLTSRFGTEAGLAGETTIFGQMPDWNPAEIIGNLPGPLAYSLYEILVTDEPWAIARKEMGYRDLRQWPLMTSFAGRPYIDVRRSLNSFLPSDLESDVAAKLVNYQLGKLSDQPKLHDRLEFAIAIPNMDFAFDDRMPELREAGLDPSEIESFRDKLGRLTREIVEKAPLEMAAHARRISELEEHRSSRPCDGTAEAIGSMLELCVKLGTIPFAAVARHGFIGVSFLKSLVTIGVLDDADVEHFLRSIRTVAGDFVIDIGAIHRNELGRGDFLRRYGHLRPGTYDITSLRYDEMPDALLGGAYHAHEVTGQFELTSDKKHRIGALLEKVGLPLDPDGFFDYIAEAIRLRELAKFQFTHTLSDILNAIVAWGGERGLERHDLAWLTVDEILADGSRASLRESIDRAMDEAEVHRLIRLPHLIDSVHDVDVIRLPLGVPTYITNQSVTAPAIVLATNEVVPINGQIVLVERADPGLDWILSHDIAGLVTKFGGANSHMAIRCAEFGLPAAIGCGERMYESLVKSRMVELNCAAGSVRPVSMA